MIPFTLRHTLPAAYALLPPAMESPAASALVLAIGIQETQFRDRRQVTDNPNYSPARGFWQFERGTVGLTLRHRSAARPLENALRALRYDTDGPDAVDRLWQSIEHNDVAACCFARCLLWTLPMRLPTQWDPEAGWAQYLAAWRPGKPHEATWANNFAVAWDTVLTQALDLRQPAPPPPPQ